MISLSPGVDSGEYVMPPELRDVLTAEPAGNRWAGFDAAMAFARAGVPVLPCQPGGKSPLKVGPFRHGVRSATADTEAVRDAFVYEPSANVGIAPDSSFVVLDVDPRHVGTLEAVQALGLPIDGYRERSGAGGWHLPVMMPRGVPATRSVTVAAGVEVKAHGSYVVSPHSRLDDGGWYRVESGRDVWAWPEIPATWGYLSRLTESRTATTSAGVTVTAQDRKDASWVVKALQRGKYAKTVALILEGRWSERYPSRSEADAGLALMASHFLRDHQRRAEIIAALIDRYSAKAPSHSKPAQYVSSVTTAGSSERDRRDIARLARVRLLAFGGDAQRRPPQYSRLAKSDHLPFPGPDPRTVSDATSNVGGDVSEAVMAFVTGIGAGDEWAGEAGWARLPVQDLAEVLGCSRETIRRHIVRLVSEGRIETQVHKRLHDGRHRADRWARLVQS